MSEALKLVPDDTAQVWIEFDDENGTRRFTAAVKRDHGDWSVGVGGMLEDRRRLGKRGAIGVQISWR